MNTIPNTLILALTTAAGFSTASLSAAVVQTIDYTALEGTSWANVNTTPVRVDFGDGLGMGTVTITNSLNGGFMPVSGVNVTSESYTGLPLGNGDVLNKTSELVFSMRSPTVPPAGELIGFTMSIVLDEGEFPEGSILMIRSLDWTAGGIRQYVQIGDGLSEPYDVNLPSDTSLIAATGTMVEISPGLYGPEDPGTVARGKAFPIDGDSFTFSILADRSFNGGIAMAIAVPTTLVPEPSVTLSALAGFGLLCFTRRR